MTMPVASERARTSRSRRAQSPCATPSALPRATVFRHDPARPAPACLCARPAAGRRGRSNSRASWSECSRAQQSKVCVQRAGRPGAHAQRARPTGHAGQWSRYPVLVPWGPSAGGPLAGSSADGDGKEADQVRPTRGTCACRTGLPSHPRDPVWNQFPNRRQGPSVCRPSLQTPYVDGQDATVVNPCCEAGSAASSPPAPGTSDRWCRPE
jgi:hypothetical protein